MSKIQQNNCETKGALVVRLGSDAQNGRSTPSPPNVTIKASPDLPRILPGVRVSGYPAVRVFASQRQSASGIRLTNQANCLLRNYPRFVCFQSRTSLSLFDFNSIFTQNTTRSFTENRIQE